MANVLTELVDMGQSIWLDNIRRTMFASGDLQKLVDSGLRGMTSNPTIFEKAIGAGDDYDAQLRELARDDDGDVNHVFEALAIDDIRHACDVFRPLYDRTNGADGFVSLEVSPLLARDGQGTIDAAHRMWSKVDRPNVMIKIPSTDECLEAITEVVAAGINVNVTLIFSRKTYGAVADAYVRGLEKRAAAGGSLVNVASVASVFVSRIDGAVDAVLQPRADAGDERARAQLGKLGIANLKLVYADFAQIFAGARFVKLQNLGAHPQRPLWASTSTKNPSYPELMYVENLVGEQTVNTLPPATLDALVAHGRPHARTIGRDLEGAHATFTELHALGVDVEAVMTKLQADGVASFAKSYDDMLAAIGAKIERFAADAAVAK